MRRLAGRLRRLLCCPPPPRVTGLVAVTGAGSGEVMVAWDPSPAPGVAHYRVHRRVSPGVWRPLATVDPASHDPGFPGKVVLLDWPGAFPGGGAGGGDEDGSGRRTYAVAAVGASGAEGPWSMPASGSPP